MTTQPPTDDQLAAMRERTNAATDFGKDNYFETHSWGDKDGLLAFNLEGDLVGTEQQVMADKAFLTNARADMTTLLDEVARLRKMLATLPMDEMNIALEISGETQYGHRVVNLLTWHNDNEMAVNLITRQWHDAHAVKE